MKIEFDKDKVKVSEKDGKIVIETEEITFNPPPQYTPPVYVPCDPPWVPDYNPNNPSITRPPTIWGGDTGTSSDSDVLT